MAMATLLPLWKHGRAPELFRFAGGLGVGVRLQVTAAIPHPPPQASALAAVVAAGLPPREPHTRAMTHLASQVSLELPHVVERSMATKAARDPERPKKPASPWIRYLAEFRQQRKDLHHKDVMKVAAGEWKTMQDSKKTQWTQPYETEKANYEKAFKEYAESGKLEAWKRDPAKPKRPLTPFLEFTGEFRQKNAALKVTEATKQASSAWKLLTPDQKAPYEKRFEEATKKYKVEMEEYKSSGKEAAWKEKKGLTAKEELKQKELEKKQKARELKAAKKAKEAAQKAKAKELKAKKKEAEAAKKAKKKEMEAAKKAKKAEMAKAKKLKAQEAKAAKAAKAKVSTTQASVSA